MANDTCMVNDNVTIRQCQDFIQLQNDRLSIITNMKS